MYIIARKTPNSPRKSIQIVESIRTGDKVKQRIVRYVGVAMNDDEETKLRVLAEKTIIPNILKERQESTGQTSLFEMNYSRAKRGRKPKKTLADVIPTNQVSLDEIVEVSRVTEGIHEVCGPLFDELGLNTVLAGTAGELFKDMVFSRIAGLGSKRRSCSMLNAQFNKEVSEDRVYRMMDKLDKAIPSLQTLIRSASTRLLDNRVSLLLFDVTTLYFESEIPDELRTHGFSKDQKAHLTQVVLALATSQEGLPMGYQLFKGNQAETGTLIQSIDAWKAQGLQVDSICFVADRAMFNEPNLKALEESGISYVVAAKLKTLSKALKSQCLDNSYTPWVIENTFVWGKEIPLPDTPRRLIVTYSSKRHRKELKERQSILEKIQSKLSKGQKSLITNKAYRQFLSGTKDETLALDPEKVELASQWDGLHGVITNDPTKTPAEILSLYHRLWVIEDSFRLNKHTLQMRPIYHFKPARIRAHIAICYTAFAIARYLEYRVSLTQTQLSFAKIRDELLSVQASILAHKRTNDRYRLPSPLSVLATRIYRAFGLHRNTDAHPLIS